MYYILTILSWISYLIGFALIIVSIKLMLVSKNKIIDYLSGLGGIKEVALGDNKMEGEVSICGEAYNKKVGKIVPKKSYSISYTANLLD